MKDDEEKASNILVFVFVQRVIHIGTVASIVDFFYYTIVVPLTICGRLDFEIYITSPEKDTCIRKSGSKPSLPIGGKTWSTIPSCSVYLDKKEDQFWQSTIISDQRRFSYLRQTELFRH